MWSVERKDGSCVELFQERRGFATCVRCISKSFIRERLRNSRCPSNKVHSSMMRMLCQHTEGGGGALVGDLGQARGATSPNWPRLCILIPLEEGGRGSAVLPLWPLTDQISSWLND